MNADTPDSVVENNRPFRIVDLNYVSLYAEDFSDALAFYTRVFGAPENAVENELTYGWRMGRTWMTLFPAAAGTVHGSNPRNAEFAVQVAAAEEVDALYGELIAAGAKNCMAPSDTEMYEPMRFACVDDPFGVRIDIYCPTTEAATS